MSLPLVFTLQELLRSRVMGCGGEAVKEVGESERKGHAPPPTTGHAQWGSRRETLNWLIEVLIYDH